MHPTFEYRGYTITVEQDENPLNPDEMGENVVFLSTNHRDFKMDPPKDVTDNINWKQWKKFPLYAYIHSGVSLSLRNDIYPFNDRFDACQVGNVFVKKSKRKGFNLEEVAQSYVNAWNDFLSGDVWVYIIDKDGEQIDSCGGFYSDVEFVMDEARDAVDELIGLHEEAKNSGVHTLDRNTGAVLLFT